MSSALTRAFGIAWWITLAATEISAENVATSEALSRGTSLPTSQYGIGSPVAAAWLAMVATRPAKAVRSGKYPTVPLNGIGIDSLSGMPRGRELPFPHVPAGSDSIGAAP